MKNNRRDFLKQLGFGTLGLTALPHLQLFANEAVQKKLFFKISLAEWSLHKALFAKEITNLDFPGIAAKKYGIHAVEYVNQFFKDKAQDKSYLNDLNTRARDNGVTNVLIMIDGEGDLGSTIDSERTKAVENHYKWLDAAKHLGCHSIRVNAAGKGTADEVKTAAIDGLGRLSEYASKMNMNVIVENHGGYSSNADWLTSVMKSVGRKNLGTLPDFGNFYDYDRYKGTEEMMPFAKGVSAKSFDFDSSGSEKTIDFRRMLQIVKESGYRGYVGIEYEGEHMSEDAGIKATKLLLEKIGAELS
ncbi:MAG TPA: sugar phosphate isomerase/epimerase family protein [Sphingobacteriaceae bacterium]